jgi:hypothetical protein
LTIEQSAFGGSFRNDRSVDSVAYIIECRDVLENAVSRSDFHAIQLVEACHCLPTRCCVMMVESENLVEEGMKE